MVYDQLSLTKNDNLQDQDSFYFQVKYSLFFLVSLLEVSKGLLLLRFFKQIILQTLARIHLDQHDHNLIRNNLLFMISVLLNYLFHLHYIHKHSCDLE